MKNIHDGNKYKKFGSHPLLIRTKFNTFVRTRPVVITESRCPRKSHTSMEK